MLKPNPAMPDDEAPNNLLFLPNALLKVFECFASAALTSGLANCRAKSNNGWKTGYIFSRLLSTLSLSPIFLE